MAKKILSVNMAEDTRVFNYTGRQLSTTMDGLSLVWEVKPERVVVTSRHHQGREVWIGWPAITKIDWVDDER